MSTAVKMVTHSPVCILGDIDLSFFSSSFCSACQIDCISKETVTWHPLAYDTCDYLTSMDSYCYLQREKITLEYLKSLWLICCFQLNTDIMPFPFTSCYLCFFFPPLSGQLQLLQSFAFCVVLCLYLFIYLLLLQCYVSAFHKKEQTYFSNMHHAILLLHTVK